jgi:hypothetical protein
MGTPIAFTSGSTNTFNLGTTKRATIALNPATSLTSGFNWFNGVDVSATQYLIYSDTFSQGQATIANARPTAWTTPDLSDASLLALINTLPDRVGLNGFTDINVALQWLEDSEKYFLIKGGYNNIVTNGLVLNLDAGWASSYPGSGTAWTDLSGNGDNGTLVNGVGFSTNGGGSLNFDGSDDYVETTNTNSLANFTAEVWFYPTAVQFNAAAVISTVYPGTNGTVNYAINWDGGIFRAGFFNGNWHQFTIPNPVLNQWNHYVLTYNGSIMIAYSGSAVQIGSLVTSETAAGGGPTRIGRRWDIADEFLGQIAIARVYNRALSTTEIQRNYDIDKTRFGFGGQSLFNGVTQYLDFSKLNSYPGSGTLVTDITGNGNDATFNNGSFTTFNGVKCFNATGSSSWLLSDPVTLGGNYTIFIWANMLAQSQVPDWRTLVRSNTPGDDHELIVRYSDNLLGYYDNENGTGFNSYGINVANAGLENNWILYTLVGENATSQKVYINNGTLNASVNRNAGGQQIYAIGNYQGGTQQFGYVSNYILYNNQAFTQTQVNQYFDATKQYYGYAQNNTITNGLVFSLDAGNPISYPGSGTVWYDLSNFGRNTTLYNGPTYSSSFGGTINFDGLDDYASPGSLGAGFSTFTVEIWFKSDSVQNYRNPIDCNYLIENGSYSNLGPRLEQDSAGKLVWVVGSGNDVYAFVTVLSSGMSSTPYHYAAITKTSSSNFDGYYNGSFTSNLSFSNWTGTMLNLNLGRGFSTSSERWFIGNIPVVRIYNRALSASEILQNFNAQKSRFGL